MTGSTGPQLDKRQVPKWINESYFSKILEQTIPDFKAIRKFSAINATQPGENYVSIMVRVRLDIERRGGSTQSLSFILKCTLESTDAESVGAMFVNNLKPFPREIQMYQNILPKCSRLYREKGLDIEFGPKCLQVLETPERTTLVLEDLKDRDFENIDRLRGLNMDHMRATLAKLAEFHAATAVLADLEGPYDSIYDITFFSDTNRSIMEASRNERKEMAIEAMKKWNMENAEYYISKLPQMDAVLDTLQEISVADPDGFNVLNHGDAWSNNIMFVHDHEGKVQETLFVDFQMGKWGSPAQDLWYLITTSASLDIKLKHFDQFIFIYHSRLSECLKLLSYSKKILTLSELHIMMIQKSAWSYLTATTVMTATLFPTDSDANMDNMFKQSPEATDLKKRVLINPFYANAMKQLFPFWEYKGALDFPTGS